MLFSLCGHGLAWRARDQGNAARTHSRQVLLGTPTKHGIAVQRGGDTISQSSHVHAGPGKCGAYSR